MFYVYMLICVYINFILCLCYVYMLIYILDFFFFPSTAQSAGAFREVDAVHSILQIYTLLTSSTQITINETNSEAVDSNEISTDAGEEQILKMNQEKNQ